jgi:hypothetical protein
LIGLLVWSVVITLTVLFFYHAAKNKQQATFVDQDTIEFVVKGSKLANVLENIDKWHYQKDLGYLVVRKATLNVKGEVTRDTNRKIVITKHLEPVTDALILDGKVEDDFGVSQDNGKPRSRDWFGFYWVSAFYPWWKVHQFLVPHLRIKPETEINNADPLEKALSNSVNNPAKDAQDKDIPGTTWEKSLLWKFPRPVLVREAEFSDLYRADILLEVICQIVKPRALVFTYRERFFPNVERAVQAAVIDYLRKFEGGYDAFITGGITGSQSPFYWEALNPLNFGDQGLIQEFGVYMIDARVVHIKLAKLNQDAQDALLAEKVAIATGKGVVAEAKARAEAIKTVADAEAEALRAQIAASSEEVMKAKLRKEALVENEVVTHLVEHGAVQVQIQK